MAAAEPLDPDLHLAYLLELRVRARGNPEGRAVIDRALALVARARTARDPAEMVTLALDVERLADDLALRYGAPRAAILQ